MIFMCTFGTPLGQVTVRAEEGAVTGFWFVGQKYYPEKTDTWVENPDYPVFEELRAWTTRYFRGENPLPAFPIKPKGTPFQQRVWGLLQQIPYGRLSTYGMIAKESARKQGRAPMFARAVGGAVGHNPVSLLIPCHRVIGSSGKLTGYAGGIDKKKALLQLEGVDFTARLLP